MTMKKAPKTSKKESTKGKRESLSSKDKLKSLEQETELLELELKEDEEKLHKVRKQEIIDSQRNDLDRESDNSFVVFSSDVLGYEDSDHQVEWELIAEDEDYHKIALAAPRNHAKTTVFSVKYPLWKIKKDPNVRIVLVSNAGAQASSFLREIVGNIERNQKYIDWAGNLKPLKPEKWTDSEIIVNRSNLRIKDPTISAVGIGGTLLSKRADVIICDDILNKENTRTPEQRRKVREWFYEVLLPILEPDGRIIVCGTLWDPADLLTELLEDPEWDYRRKFKAIIADADRQDLWEEYYEIWQSDRQLGNEFYEKNKEKMLAGSVVLWEKRFNYRTLWHMRKKNSYAFARMYQSEHISRIDQPFKEEWIARAKAMGASLKLVSGMQEWIDNYNVIKIRLIMQGMDLAGGPDEDEEFDVEKEVKGDDTVVLTLAKAFIGKYVLLNIEKGKYSPDQTRKTLREQYLAFKPSKIKVESVGIQKWIKRDFAEDKVFDMPIEGYSTGSEKWDEQIGLLSIAVLMENGKLILPYDKKDARTIRLVDDLVDSMRKFPNGHTGDDLMALWFALIAHRDVLEGQETVISVETGDIRSKSAIQTDDTEDDLESQLMDN